MPAMLGSGHTRRDRRGDPRYVEGQRILVQAIRHLVQSGPEANLPAIHGLCDLATTVFVPTGATRDDLDSVIPWMNVLLDAGTKAAFILNKVNRRTTSFTKYRGRLLKAGPICPIEIPTLEDIHTQSDNGLTVLDITRSKGHEPMEGLWTFAQRETAV